jgi:hypothetical protein
VRSVSDIIETRRRAIGVRFNTDLIEVLEREEPGERVYAGNLAEQISGKRKIPVEQIGKWLRALQLDGPAAKEFEVAVRLTHSDDMIRELIERQDLQLAEARATMLLYEDRIGQLAEIAGWLNDMRLRRIAGAEPMQEPPPPAT